MNAYNILLLMVLLQTKHLVVDWMWQPKFEWSNKGTYGHMGGIVHAFKNALGTAFCFGLVGFSWTTMWWVFVFDYIVHYHVDFAKMNINRIMKWGPLTHSQFWWLTGFDQYLHQITYIGLIWYAVQG